jgi:hypothetical protein
VRAFDYQGKFHRRAVGVEVVLTSTEAKAPSLGVPGASAPVYTRRFANLRVDALGPLRAKSVSAPAHVKAELESHVRESITSCSTKAVT